MTKTAVILLETERMYLRDLRADDVEWLFQLDSDPEVMRHISKGVSTPRNIIEAVYLPRMMAWQNQSPPRGFWAAHLREEGEFIGWFHLRPDKISPEEMELGYRLKRGVWGRGLATEGSRSLVKKALGQWGYPKVCARTLAGNLASRRVMEKAGLAFEREFTYCVEVLPGWSEAERRAVKYSVASVKALMSAPRP
jgi:RimJ/RimL family protein N-acetyltransferase